jgi:hypothetical protein
MHNAAHSLHLAYYCLKGPYHKIFKPILEYRDYTVRGPPPSPKAGGTHSPGSEGVGGK